VPSQQQRLRLSERNGANFRFVSWDKKPNLLRVDWGRIEGTREARGSCPSWQRPTQTNGVMPKIYYSVTRDSWQHMAPVEVFRLKANSWAKLILAKRKRRRWLSKCLYNAILFLNNIIYMHKNGEVVSLLL